MENGPELKFQSVLENVRRHFDFLFRRGFWVASLIFVDPEYKNWRIILMDDDCLITIYNSTGDVNVALNTLRLHRDVGLFELKDLIYLIKGDEISSELQEGYPPNEAQGFEKIAGLLEKYMDEVLREIREIPSFPSSDHIPKTPLEKPGQLSEDNCPGSVF
jgi:hypothetical protein